MKLIEKDVWKGIWTEFHSVLTGAGIVIGIGIAGGFYIGIAGVFYDYLDAPILGTAWLGLSPPAAWLIWAYYTIKAKLIKKAREAITK